MVKKRLIATGLAGILSISGCGSFSMREDGPRSESSFFDLQADGRGRPYWPNRDLVKIYEEASFKGEEGILGLYKNGINFLGNDGGSEVIRYSEVRDLGTRDMRFGRDELLITSDKKYNFKLGKEEDLMILEAYLRKRARIDN